MFQTTNQIVPHFSISSNFSGVTTESWVVFSWKPFFLYHLYPVLSYIIHQNLYKSVSDELHLFANLPRRWMFAVPQGMTQFKTAHRCSPRDAPNTKKTPSFMARSVTSTAIFVAELCWIVYLWSA